MNIELLYTSAAQGLKQGSRGFCTVLSTVGLPVNLAQKLESISGYRHLYPPGDARAALNPINHSHLKFNTGGRTVSVISRIAAYGVDYSQRTNKIAHHISIERPLPKSGPAVVLAMDGVMRTEWDNECKTLLTCPNIPDVDLQPEVCKQWEAITGDAGWAGVVANAWLHPNPKPVWIIFAESQSSVLLKLMVEATALLPENKRWDATFSTYCTNLPPDVECRVRCVISGSEEARMAIARGLVIDLNKPMQRAADSVAINAARTGRTIGIETVSHSSPIADDHHDEKSEAMDPGTSSEADYQVSELSNIPPALFRPPKSSRKTGAAVALPRNEQERTGESRKGMRTALIAGAATVLFLGLSASVLYLFWQSKKLSQIVEPERGEVAKKTKPPDADHPRKDPDADPKFTSSPPDELAKKDLNEEKARPIEPPAIRFENRTIASWAENQPIPTPQKVADVIVSGNHDDTIKMIAGDPWFSFDESTNALYLKESHGYDYETIRVLEAKFECNGIENGIQVRIENVNEPTLTLRILEGENRLLDFTFPGQTLSVTSSGYLNESSPASTPPFQWLGQLENNWEVIEGAKAASYSLSEDCKYSKLKVTCGMVESNEVTIIPLGEVTIEMNSLFRVTKGAESYIPGLRIQIGLPQLKPLGKRSRRRYEFADLKGTMSDGQPVIVKWDLRLIPNNGTMQVKLPEIFIGQPPRDLQQAESTITRLVLAVQGSHEATKQFRSSLKHIEQGGDATRVLKQFLSGFTLPDDLGDLNAIAIFIDDIEIFRQLQLFMQLYTSGDRVDLGAFHGRVQELSRRFIQSTNETSRKSSLNDIEVEFAELSRRFGEFEDAFPAVLQRELKNSHSAKANPLQEIIVLAKVLNDSSVRSPALAITWKQLLNQSIELADAIESVQDLKMTLAGNSKVTVWDEERTDGKMDSSKNRRTGSVSYPTLFKLHVIPWAGTQAGNSRESKPLVKAPIPNAAGKQSPLKQFPAENVDK